jgi:hypothetical protein
MHKNKHGKTLAALQDLNKPLSLLPTSATRQPFGPSVVSQQVTGQTDKVKAHQNCPVLMLGVHLPHQMPWLTAFVSVSSSIRVHAATGLIHIRRITCRRVTKATLASKYQTLPLRKNVSDLE